MVSIEHLRRVGMPTGDAYSSGHLVPPLRDLHMFYLLIPILLPNLSLFFRTMIFENPSVLSRFCSKITVLRILLIKIMHTPGLVKRRKTYPGGKPTLQLTRYGRVSPLRTDPQCRISVGETQHWG